MTHTCTDICTWQPWFLANPPPCFPVSLQLAPFIWFNPSFYLLGDPASFAHGANTHPLLSLVCYQLFSPCCFTHPKAPHRSSYIFTQMTSTTSAFPSNTVCAQSYISKQIQTGISLFASIIFVTISVTKRNTYFILMTSEYYSVVIEIWFPLFVHQ